VGDGQRTRRTLAADRILSARGRGRRQCARWAAASGERPVRGAGAGATAAARADDAE